ncbi:hypothetical protein [Streptomyces fructofermentans]|uniref:Uncharacterized protein n=1 Tax=Streptomyces fructofermentans TaxID=152141 RepID=A0A918NVR0_9ACTN|nr:hypothetical protein [Streptomyces fructofermentans]GGY00147.1 hypothetical protein GCM10010515_77610 [Streptomyces fructofermentans]
MSRDLQHALHAALTAAAARIDLPLDGQHLERLALELAPDVAALLGRRTAQSYDLEVPASAADGDDGERYVREYAGCRLSIQPDVTEDAPAALLGLELQRSQSDVLALDVAGATSLVVTVRPRSPQAWDWWLAKFDAVTCSAEQPCCTTTTGRYGEIAVELRGEGVPDILADRSADRLSTVTAGHPW